MHTELRFAFRKVCFLRETEGDTSQNTERVARKTLTMITDRTEGKGCH